MTIFQHTIDKVLDGTKTRTSRLWKPGERLIIHPQGDFILSAKDYLLWRVGQEQAIQPARTAKSEGRYLVLSLGKQDVRAITDEEVAAEGFQYHIEYFDVWCRMHDWPWYKSYLKTVPIHAHMPSPVVLPHFYASLWRRPREGHYLAWIINFEVCK